MTGLSLTTLVRDVAYGHLHAFKRRAGVSSPFFVDRDVARHYVARMTGNTVEKPHTATVIGIDQRRAVR